MKPSSIHVSTKLNNEFHMQGYSSRQTQMLEKIRVSQIKVEQREKKMKTQIAIEDLREDDGDHGIAVGYVRRNNNINEVSPILANLFSPSKKNLNAESHRLLLNEKPGYPGFTSQRQIGQSLDF